MTNSLKDLEFKVIDNIPAWAVFIPEIATRDGVEYHKKKGSQIIYRQVGTEFRCFDCDTKILAVKVVHPIHDGPFPLSGSGRCEYEQVPYCPTCEQEPNPHGTPIRREPEIF